MTRARCVGDRVGEHALIELTDEMTGLGASCVLMYMCTGDVLWQVVTGHR